MLVNKLILALIMISPTLILIPIKGGQADPGSNVTLGLISLDGDEVMGTGDIVDKQRFGQDLINYIATNLGNETTPNLITVNNISSMVGLIKAQKVDLFIDSPFITALVDNKSGAIPFVGIWPEKKSEYSSLIVTKKSSPIIYHIYDLHGGKSLGFTSADSSVGYFLPKSFLIGNGLKFSPPSSPADIIYIFTGSENETISKLMQGTIDAGVLSSTYFNSLPSSEAATLKVIDKTIEIPIGIISHRSDIDPQLIVQISKIMTNMKTDPQASENIKQFISDVNFDFKPTQLIENLTGMVTKAINGTESSYS